MDYIRNLPLYPMPEAFGLHDNCNITCAQEEALKLLLGMQSMVPAGGGGGDGKSADDVMDATATSIQDKLPRAFALDVCEQKFPTRYEVPFNIQYHSIDSIELSWIGVHEHCGEAGVPSSGPLKGCQK